MGGMGVKQVTVIAALAAAMALASCAVGPDFATPTAPETGVAGACFKIPTPALDVKPVLAERAG